MSKVRIEAGSVEEIHQLTRADEVAQLKYELAVTKAAIAAHQANGTIPLMPPIDLLQEAMVARLRSAHPIALPPAQPIYTQPPLPVTAQVVPPEYYAQPTIEQMAIAEAITPTQVVHHQGQKRSPLMSLILVPLEHPILILLAIAGVAAGLYLKDPTSFQPLMQHLGGGSAPVETPAPAPSPEKK